MDTPQHLCTILLDEFLDILVGFQMPQHAAFQCCCIQQATIKGGTEVQKQTTLLFLNYGGGGTYLTVCTRYLSGKKDREGDDQENCH